MGGPNKNNSDKKNPANGVVWVDLTKTIVRKKNPAKGGIWVDLTSVKGSHIRCVYSSYTDGSNGNIIDNKNFCCFSFAS